jgi:surface polysaccharide O-acyltransferase-like enzyme
VLFYSLAIVLLFTLLDYPISLPAYIKSLFPITSGRWWFITSYFYLFLLSPFINRSLNSLSTRQDIFLLIALFLPNVLSGFVFGYSVIGTSQGHSIFTFIFYYVVGRMLRKHYQPSRGKLKYFLGYMLSVTLIFLGGVFIWHNFKSHIATLWGEQNNPLILLSAIAFFYVFYNMNIKSRFINWVAGSTLGVYLISDHPIVRAYLYENLFVIDTYSGTDTFFIPLFLMAVAIFVSCIVIDKIREAIFKPLLARIFGSEKIIEAEKKFDEIVRDIEVPKS